MKAVVQRVSEAEVLIDGLSHGKINHGLLVLLGIRSGDNETTVKWFAKKLANHRIYPDSEAKMNKSVMDIQGARILVISNFTLYGEISNGFRPSFSDAARPEHAEPLYNQLLDEIRNNYQVNLQSGVFGAIMQVSLINDGPVTLIIEKD